MKFAIRMQILIKAVLVLLLHFRMGQCHNFHRNTTGVSFSISVYVHNIQTPDSISDRNNYTLEDVKTMMKVISSRFSKIATYGVGSEADSAPFQPNSTYNKSFSQVFSAEAVALVNKEMSEKDAHWIPIQVYQGIRLHSNTSQLAREVELAKECSEKANKIFRGTVRGFIFNHESLMEDVRTLKNVLYHLEKLRDSSLDSLRSLKLGTRQICADLERSDSISEELEVKMQIITATDFVICEEYPLETRLTRAAAFARVSKAFLKYKRDIKMINPRIEVMGQTGWPEKSDSQWEVDEMQEYWHIVDEWAANENFTVWMFEAFDNPWRKLGWNDTRAGHHGWWKLAEDSKTHVVDNYIEKASKIQSESHGHSETTKSPVKTPTNTPASNKQERCGLTSALGILVAFYLRLVI